MKMFKIHFILLLWTLIILKDSSGRIIVMDHRQITSANPSMKEVTNLNRMPVRLLYYETLNSIESGKNQTKAPDMYISIWNVLGEYLNFTLIPNRLDAEQYPGLDRYKLMMRLLVENKSDVAASATGTIIDQVESSLQYYTTNERFYTRPAYKINENWISTLVDYNIWFVIGGLLVTMAIIGWFSDQFLSPEISRLSMTDQLFYNLSVLCIQGSQPGRFQNGFKILSLMRCVLVFMVWAFIGTFLYAQVTMKIRVNPFNNAQELLTNTNITIVAVAKNFHHGPLRWILKHPLYTKRVELGNNVNYPYEKACSADGKKYVSISTDRFFAIFKSMCELKQIGEKISTIHYAGRVRSGFPYKRSFDVGILKMWESGVMKRIIREWRPPYFYSKSSISDSEVKPLGLEHFKYVFGLWALGILLAFVTFVGEVIIWDCQVNRKQKNIKMTDEKEHFKTVEPDVQLFEFVP